ncbi:melatonin receptor type 1B-like [Montipora capricornis]|uniref:melatonin receptor type 1B-like n=1 Tax=Montipora capricornis TaxID=246305 RepID=UPI0035F1E316
MEISLSTELSLRSRNLALFESFLFAVINVAAIFGNLSVCYAVYRKQSLRTLANMFIVALAVSDILMSTCCMPFTVATLIRGRWIFGDNFCRFHGFAAFTCGLASLLTMGIIAVSRYFCIVKPHKYLMIFNARKTFFYIAALWSAAFIGSVPPFFFKSGGFEFQPGKAMCLYTFETHIAYTAFIECFYVATPLLLITTCYTIVFYTVWQTNRNFSPDKSPRRLRANIEEAKVTKTLAMVMAGFACCWLPIGIVDYIDAARGQHTLPRQVYLMYSCLAYLSSTINPLIYGVMNRHFRREYKVMFRKALCLQNCQNVSISEETSGSEGRKFRKE